MSQLKLHFLGSPFIERNGQYLETDTRKALALLAYCAGTGQPHTRDEIVTLLWPELPEPKGRAALRRTLSSIRRMLNDDEIRISRDTITLLQQENIWIDIQKFDEKSNSDQLIDLKAAADLYRDDFLTGFTLRDSVTFDDWQYEQGEVYRRKLQQLLNRLIDWYTEQGQFEQAVPIGQRLLGLDPLQEDVQRKLMTLYVWTDERNLALRQYQLCRKVFAEELGVEPITETKALFQAIKDNKVKPPESAPHLKQNSRQVQEPAREVSRATSDPSSIKSISFVGRDDVLAQLQEAFKIAQDRNSGYLCTVIGEAGIGKSRLVEEFLQTINANNCTLMLGRCFKGESMLAYAPLVQLLRDSMRQPQIASRVNQLPTHWKESLQRLLPELEGKSRANGDNKKNEVPLAQTQFLSGVLELFRHLSHNQQAIVLFIDDVQWMDRATFDLLTFCLRRMTDFPVLIVLSYQEADGETIQFVDQLAGELRRQRRIKQIKLSRLTQENIAQLVETLPYADELDHSRLFQETEGVPFFINEYLHAYSKNGQNINGAFSWNLPQNVKDLLWQRISSIDDLSLQLLQVAAVIGRSLKFGIWHQASGRTIEETLSVLQNMLASGLLVEKRSLAHVDQSPIYEFYHSKFSLILYEQINPVRVKLIHERVAGALIDEGKKENRLTESAAQISRHFQLAGAAPELIAQYSKMAGDFAMSVYAYREALDQYQISLKYGYPAGEHLLMERGKAFTHLGRYRSAQEEYASVLENTSDPTAAEAHFRIGLIHERVGDWLSCNRAFEEAEVIWHASLTDSPETNLRLVELYIAWSRLNAYQKKFEQAAELAQKAEEMAGESNQHQAEVSNILGLLARLQGDQTSAIDAFKRCLSLAKNSDELVIAASNNLALVYMDTAAWPEAEMLLQTAVVRCKKIGDRHREAALYNNLADVYHHQGEKDLSMENLKKAMSHLAQIGSEVEGWQPEIWKLTTW